jgi:type II secretory pathway component GspD/PulD (secretin)
MYREKKTTNMMSVRKRVFVWSLVVIAMTATVAAGAAAPPQIIDKFEVEEDFGVRKALAMLGSQCQKNIVPSPSVDGVLAFRSLRNVTFEEAMDAILGENFKYEQEGKLIKVYTKEEYKRLKEDPDRMVHKVFTLYYITAQEAQNLIQPVLSGSAKIQVSSPAEKGISGGVGGTSGGAAGGASGSSSGGGDSMASNDTIVVFDFPERVAQVEEVLNSVDIMPKQVLVEATILSAVLDEDMDLGVNWNLLNGESLTGSLPDIAAVATGTPIETAGFATPGNGLKVGFTSGDLVGFIRALESTTDVTVLANPKILALNKQEGSVLIGQNLGYRSSTTISTGGVATEGEVQFLETGTQLVFRPYIGNDGYIRMEIYPKDSSAELDADGVPQETTTELRTNIMVKDGETVVIGGLFRDVVTTTRNQVPLLGDIPIVGLLFRGVTDTTQRQEVMIMLTPHIIEEPSQAMGQARAEDVSRKRTGAKDGLQSMSRKKLAEDHYARAAKCYIEGDVVSALDHANSALTLRPTYLEALRLKEKILADMDPGEVENLERIVNEKVEKDDSEMWNRR